MILKDLLIQANERNGGDSRMLRAIVEDTSKYDGSKSRKNSKVSVKDEAIMVGLAMNGFSYDRIREEMGGKYSRSMIIYRVQQYRPPGEIVFKLGKVRALFKAAEMELPVKYRGL